MQVAGVHSAGWRRVTVYAERVHPRTREQARIAGAVWFVARRAAFNLHRRVLKNKGPALLAVTLEANRILHRR